MYADKITDSMQYAIDETQRRREYKWHITKNMVLLLKQSIKIHDVISATVDNDDTNEKQQTEVPKKMTKKERQKTIENIEKK